MSAVKYQTMPPLSPDEYSELEASILEHGIQVPIITDEHGVVIDGHHRKMIAEHHGLHLPREVRAMLPEAEKTALSITLNVARRQLSREQRRAIVEASVKAQPEATDREHARRTGASPSTVGAVRADLEASGEVSKLDTRVDPRGYGQPASRPVRVHDMTVDERTGEVLDGPPIEAQPIEVTRTESFKTVEKLVPTQKPVPTGAEANRLNAIQSAKSIGRSLEALQHLNYERARVGIVTDWWPIGKAEVPPEQAAYFTPAELRKLAQGFNATADLLEAHHGG